MNYPPTGATLVDELTEVIDFVRITPSYGNNIFRYHDNLIEETRVFYADSTMFRIFDHPLLEGDKRTALSGPDKVVLTRSLTEKIFGPYDSWQRSPVGQVINLNNNADLLVSGIVEDPPPNTHLKFSALISFDTFENMAGDLSAVWGWNEFYTYVLTIPGTTREELQSKLPAFVDRHKEPNHGNVFKATPLTDIHLYAHQSDEPETNGNAATVNGLLIVAFIILMMAWINYINLSTARSEERSREVGIKKVNGAHKTGLVFQFLSEAFLLNLVSIILSLILAYMLLPLLAGLLPSGLVFDLPGRPEFWWGVAALLSGGTVLSGLYPAFVLSSFTPGYILNGSRRRLPGKEIFRKSLVVFQFATAVALTIGTLVIYYQVEYMQNKSAGFDMNNQVVIKAPVVYNNDSIFQQRYLNYKTELKKISGVNNVTISSAVPGGNLEYEVDVTGRQVEGKEELGYRRVWRYRVDSDFIDTYNLHLIAGRKFSDKPNSGEVVVNRSAAKLFGFNNPEDLPGKKFINLESEIVGVVEDYHHQSVKSVYLPMIMENNVRNMEYYTVTLNPSSGANSQPVINQMQSSWEQIHPENPFSYFFLKDRIEHQYQNDWKLGEVFNGFAFLAMLITGLGLLGMSSYLVITRTKEIGIRKVLGATRSEIVAVLSKEFVYLLSIAAVLAIPLGYYVFNRWLQNYAWHIDISWGLLLVPVVLVSAISLMIVAGHSLKAANANPVDAIRNE